MQAIIISEKWHGTIGLAKDYQSALSFLINKYYLNKETYVWDFDEDAYALIKDKYGENWEQTLRNWNIENFNKNFEGVFFLYECNIYEDTPL